MEEEYSMLTKKQMNTQMVILVILNGDSEYCVYLQTGGASGLSAREAINNYQGYNQETTMIRKMNPEWAKVRGNKESSWTEKEKVAACMCMPNVSSWNSSNKTGAKYTLGGISIEMYVKAYNDVKHPMSGQHELGI